MHRFLTALTLAIMLVCVTGSVALSQTPFASSAGLPAAEEAAKDSLGDDALLVSVITTGMDPLTGGPAFNVETGESVWWGYVYGSPSTGEAYVHLLFQLVPGFFTGSGQKVDSAEGS